VDRHQPHIRITLSSLIHALFSDTNDGRLQLHHQMVDGGLNELVDFSSFLAMMAMDYRMTHYLAWEPGSADLLANKNCTNLVQHLVSAFLRIYRCPSK
jgi:hypothetical protein